MHYTNCYISKNQLIRDIRICTNLQRTLEINPTAKDINTWMKLSQLKMNLLNQIQHPETPDVPIEPYEFNWFAEVLKKPKQKLLPYTTKIH